MSVQRWLACFILVSLSSVAVWSDDQTSNQPTRTLLFSDDFNREESDESQEELGGTWTTSSATRANGNKQVDLRDNTLHIYIHESADHAVSVRHEIDFRDGSVELRFKLENAVDVLTLNFVDLKCKTVHAGHLFNVSMATNYVAIEDLKTGVMNLAYRDASKADRAKLDLKNLIWSKRKKFPLQLDSETWHSAIINVRGDTVDVSIDGQSVGSFSAIGIAHPTKTMLRFLVPNEAVIDDLKIYSFDS
ncbi:hypothetical protein Pla22_41150 [Rubripirellula amarantea]|uniref:3-keto-disaccharide hydrolase domain-containing protein n=1 Tax=Rubripirellula amarantea TaxID=2527999 RepID=A0A5C5WKS4_9BACT|nr:hypothetical protein [Rubripirellula amarantea]TWT51338.1 hypothetical protein Pla22_41150 [Rubripirellula amarantea]